MVKQIIETNPMALFRGYPLYNVYLRLLGAKIGKNVVIESRTTPVCTDLISIGDGTILRKDSMLLSHKARSNYIRTGGITIGKDVVVGEGSVIEADTVMEDRSQLGHASSLHVGQVIPEGKRYHGSPASPTTTDYRFHENRHVGTVRRVIFTLVQLLGCLSVTAALLCGLYYAVAFIGLPKSKPFSLDWAADTLVISLSLFFALFALRLLLVASGARLLRLFLKENKTYTLYGFHFLVFRMISSLSNSRVFNLLFGDSSYIVGYLKLVGYRFSQIVQTGTNFGLAQKHDNPFLIRIGSGTIISDGLYFGNARMSNTAFRPAKTSVGTGNFVGNNVFYPPDGKLGDNCFVATKTMVPIEGKTRSNTGLLGSPCFEIPRPDFMDQAKPGDADRRKSLRKKNAHNLIALLTLVFFGFTYFHLSVLLIYGAAQTYSIFGIWAWAVAANAILFLAIAYCVVLERGSLGFRSLVPTVVSVYDKEYWRVERLWKYSETMLRWLWLGTPFRSILSRMLGMKLGKKVFDDGLYVSEKSLVQIGDHCNLNESAVLQPHALEQLVYKSDYIKIGACCTIEANAFVHYGCTIGDHVVVGLDSFVMKGESIEANSSWRGNPAVRDVGMSYPATLPFWIASPQPRRDFAATRRGYPPFDRRPILVSARSRSDRKKTPRHGTLHAAHPSYPNAEAEMPHPGERPVRRLLTRCAALVLVALFALFQSSSELGESPLPPTAQTGPIAQSQSGTAVRTVSELHPSTAANLRPQAGSPQRISELLKQAQYHYAMKRWTRPRGNNALESYRKVLYLDPGNPTARQGINRLRDAYLARADTALARGEQAKAFFNYQRALVIDPSVSRKRIKISQTIGGPTR